MKRRHLLALAGAGAVAPSLAASAFPQRDVHLIVPSSAGSSTDTLGRELATQLERLWGVTVLVENISGAGSQLATQRLVRSPADGHVIQLTNTALFTNAALAPSLPYDTFADLRPVGSLAGLSSYLVVRAKPGWRSLGELLAATHGAPDTYSYGSSGTRSGPHIGMALLADITHSRWLHVPYRGMQEAVVDLLGGRLDMAMLPRGMALAVAAGGQATLLAITEPAPWPEARGLPALSRLYPDYRYRGIFGTVVPAATPSPVVEKINKGFKAAATQLDRSGKLGELGFTLQPGSPSEFQGLIREQVQLWRSWSQRIALD